MKNSTAAERLYTKAPDNKDIGHIPGDYGLPIIGHSLHVLRSAAIHADTLFRKHGNICRSRIFGQHIVFLFNPNTVDSVLRNEDNNFSSLKGWEYYIGRLFTDGLMLRDFNDHRYHRKLFSVAFKKTAMVNYLAQINTSINFVISSWQHNGQLRFADTVKQMNLDITAPLFLGIELGKQSAAINKAFIEVLRASMAIIRLPIPGLSLSRGIKARQYLFDYFLKMVPEKREGNGTDIFTRLCQAETEEGERFSDADIVNHIIFLMMAAHDTTSASLSTVAYGLAKNPYWQDQIRQQCLSLNKVNGEPLQFDDLQKLDIIEWSLNEAIRLYPPVPILPRRTVRNCTLEGYSIDANTKICLFPAAMMRHSSICSNPEQYDPGRFSPDRAEHKVVPLVWNGFGGGAHLCLGKNFAIMMAKVFIYHLITRYQLWVDDNYIAKYESLPVPRPKDGLPLVLKPI